MSDDHTSLHSELANAETNLRLIRERRSQFVQESDIPIQLMREEERLIQRIAELRAALGESTVTDLSGLGWPAWSVFGVGAILLANQLTKKIINKIASDLSFSILVLVLLFGTLAVLNMFDNSFVADHLRFIEGILGRG